MSQETKDSLKTSVSGGFGAFQCKGWILKKPDESATSKA
jgi:hypothetical protein